MVLLAQRNSQVKIQLVTNSKNSKIIKFDSIVMDLQSFGGVGGHF